MEKEGSDSRLVLQKTQGNSSTTGSSALALPENSLRAQKRENRNLRQTWSGALPWTLLTTPFQKSQIGERRDWEGRSDRKCLLCKHELGTAKQLCKKPGISCVPCNTTGVKGVGLELRAVLPPLPKCCNHGHKVPHHLG